VFDALRQGSDVSQFATVEREFYHAQMSPTRSGYITDMIDLEYKPPQKNIVNNDNSDSDEDTEDQEPHNLNESRSKHRNGFVRINIVTHDAVTQTHNVHVKPEIRNGKKCTAQVKSACAKVSSLGISPAMSRKCVQIVCEEMYGDTYYLSRDEQAAAEGGDDDIIVTNLNIIDGYRRGQKRKRNTPHTIEDWQEYRYVICDSKTLLEHKCIQASQVEADSAQSLMAKTDDITSTLFYDSTSRKNIDGEMPALILKLSDNRSYNLRPIMLAYEDRAQICDLIIETLERMAAALSVKTITTAKDIWEKIDNIMTDSVSKNLNIETIIAAELKSNHIPVHALCKAHTVEALDTSNLSVLSAIEDSVDLKDTIQKINPDLKSFIKGATSVAENGIRTITKLVAHDNSGSSVSLAEEFDYIIEREETVKHISLYHQRRWAQLGLTAASIIEAHPYLVMLVEESAAQNLLAESSRMYLSSEFFLTELQVLAYFTHTVTLPLLNAVATCTTSDLLTILPQLYTDLTNGKTLFI
jgi:hypothetical protein